MVHGRVLLLAAHDGAHMGETALVVSTKACLIAPADFAAHRTRAGLLCTSPFLSWVGVKARGLAYYRAWVAFAAVLSGVVVLARSAWTF